MNKAVDELAREGPYIADEDLTSASGRNHGRHETATAHAGVRVEASTASSDASSAQTAAGDDGGREGALLSILS